METENKNAPELCNDFIYIYKEPDTLKEHLVNVTSVKTLRGLTLYTINDMQGQM